MNKTKTPHRAPVEDKRSSDSASNFHLVLGAGGSKAILASTGAIAAFELCGWNDWETIGGVSGGSVPAALYAHGTRAKELVWLAHSTDFSELIKPKVGWFRRIWAICRKYRYEITLPEKGIYDPEPLRRFINISVPRWPDNLWTLSTDRQLNQVVFTAEGAHRYLAEAAFGQPMIQEPSCVGSAVAASCAIPGIVDATHFNEEPLFDGALSHEGQCAILPPQRHFGAEPNRIIALDVGEEDIKKKPFVRMLLRLTCVISACGPEEAAHPSEEEHGIILIEPRIQRFHGLKFLLDDLDKWTAIIAGFSATIDTLERHGLVDREGSPRAFELYDLLKKIPFEDQSRGDCVECIEDLFKQFDVY
ncbi:MAG: patatin-like phospholipase family protein [Candidatus Obscuribacterales bacterium]|nr:patatin-like phospholipase family protein [Candidatus Obscuribacterales bacterium]